ncbi:DUF302 domain-containing protein [Rhodococcus jostii]|nr:DUF302 domain-containing protein [Rhodococcus jostii]
MPASEPCEVRFDGVRLRFDSTKSFDNLVDALLADVGDKPVPIDDIAARFESWKSYEQQVRPHVGPSGFMLFALWNHGGWIKKAGLGGKVLRIVIGNPLIAITMLRHDVTAGLFAPVELLLTDEQHGRSALTYVRPSSLMVVEPNRPLRAGAMKLDAKLATLAAKVTAAD